MYSILYFANVVYWMTVVTNCILLLNVVLPPHYRSTEHPESNSSTGKLQFHSTASYSQASVCV